jgi:hypothetical protein
MQFRVVHNYANEQSISRSFQHFSKQMTHLYRPIDVGVEFCDSMVKACCVLHNYVRRISPYGVLGNIWNQY